MNHRFLSTLTLLIISATALATNYTPVAPTSNAAYSKQSRILIVALKQAAGIKDDFTGLYDIDDTPNSAQDSDNTIDMSHGGFGQDDFFTEMPAITAGGFDAFKQKSESNFDTAAKQWVQALEAKQQYWDAEYKNFLKKLPLYIDGLTPTKKLVERIIDPPAANTVPKAPDKTRAGQFHILPGALDIPIRDQAGRATCAAFTGARALESLLAQHNVEQDLSEQFFYWLSKPKCHSSPCASAGSSFISGLYLSQKVAEPVIPQEKNCPYNGSMQQRNETQIPLVNSCNKGVAKVTEFQTLKFNQIIPALELNQPVLIGAKLSPNFYRNRGFISYKDSQQEGDTDAHASGHAVLLIGYILLPKEISPSEGEYCLITANSWGEGWGRGGYACLTKRWLQEHGLVYASLSGVQLNP